MAFGTAGVACTYLDADRSLVMHQGRSGSDVCEHFFAKIRQYNSNPTLGQAYGLTSKICAQGAVSATLFTGGKRGGQNTSGAKREASELFEPLAKRSDFEKLKNL